MPSEFKLVSRGMNKLQLVAFKLELQASTNRSEYPFVALVTYGGKASDYPVGGTEVLEGGPYKVYIPADILAEKIKELEGKGVYAESSLSSHSNTDRIGEFIHAWTEYSHDNGQVVLEAKASGILHRDKNPELVDEIVERARAGELGFSYDLKGVGWIENTEVSNETVLEVSEFTWRGATILQRDAAAYKFTQLAAKKLELQTQKGEDEMKPEELKALMAETLSDEFGKFKTESLDPLATKVEKLEETVNTSNKRVDNLEASLKKPEGKKDDDPVKDTPKNDEPPADSMKISDLVSGIANAIGNKFIEAQKETNERLDKLVKASEEKTEESTRRTLTAGSIELLSKYADVKGEDEVTPAMVAQAAQAVRDSKISRAKKDAALEGLSALKRQLIKSNKEVA